MKKRIALLMVAVMLLLSFAACGKNNEKTQDDKPSTEDNADKEDDTDDVEGSDTKEPDTDDSSANAEKPQVNVVSRYTFDNVDGTTVPDSGSNGYTGTAFGSPEVVEGKYGKALKLSGSNGVTIPVGAGTVGKQFTVSAWINIEAGSPMRPYRVVSTGSWGNDSTGFQLGIDTSYGKGCFVYNVGTASGTPYWNRQTEFSNRIMDKQWHHVAIAFDMDSNLACGYLDGTMLDVMTIPETSDATPWSALQELCIGGSYVGGELGESFVGTVDEVCIVDYFFTESDINYLMDNTLFE